MSARIRARMATIRRLIARAVFGGISISLFAGVSVLVHEQYISPLVFSIGIMLIIVYQLSLVTRDCPLGLPWWSVGITLITNVGAAWVMGLLFRGHLPYEVAVKTDLFESILTGVIIGLVSLVNRDKSIYTVPLTILLMYAFVWCKLPHCVVYGFYLPICGGSWVCLIYAIVGNIIGGTLVHVFDIWRRQND